MSNKSAKVGMEFRFHCSGCANTGKAEILKLGQIDCYCCAACGESNYALDGMMIAFPTNKQPVYQGLF